MAHVRIDFMPRWRRPMRNGKKTMTARTRKKGEVGDVFWAFDAWFRITNVQRVRLRFVRNNWQYEGMESPEEFEAVWRKLHPRRGFHPNDWVWLHEFKRIRGRKWAA